MSFYPENEALTVRLWENKRAYECGGVAELADAADLKSASSECGFESHRPYQVGFHETRDEFHLHMEQVLRILPFGKPCL